MVNKYIDTYDTLQNQGIEKYLTVSDKSSVQSSTRLVLGNVIQFHGVDSSIKNIVLKNGRERISVPQMHKSLRLLQTSPSMFRFSTP